MSLPTINPQQKRRAAAKAALLRLTLGAMLAAMSVVIGMFCKSFLNFGEGLWRVTFENLPIILAGIFLGPITGGHGRRGIRPRQLPALPPDLSSQPRGHPGRLHGGGGIGADGAIRRP